MADFVEHTFWSDDGKFTLCWESIGEGYSGDYDPADPADRPLLRANLLIAPNDDTGTDLDPDNYWSYCTLAPEDTPKEILEKFSRDLFRDLDSGYIKSAMERWTWRTDPKVGG